MSETEIRQRITPVIALLLDSFRYARAAGRSAWDFAVEIERLRTSGITNCDLRYMISIGYAEHAAEVTHSKSRKRVFRKLHNLAFSDKTCFVLTESGESFAQQAGLFEANPGQKVIRENGYQVAHIDPHNAPLPSWHRDRRELRLGHLVVKQFKVPAPNQETILAAFDEEGWPFRIDDPLPPQVDQDSKRRLHDTINKLNRHQKQSLIHFRGDGTGRGICWELNGCLPPERTSRDTKASLVLSSE